MNDDELADVHIRMIAGDPEALPAFEAAMRPLIRGLLRARRISDADADEVWNDAFLAAVERARSITPLGKGLRQFVARVAINKSIDTVRRAKARQERPLEASDEAIQAQLAPHDHETDERVLECLAAARPAYAAVMEMTARGLTAAEIAVILGKSEGSVDKLRIRARKWFAQCLGGQLDE